MGIRLVDLFDGLEEGQSPELPRSKRGTGFVDRNRLQIVIAALERSVSALKEITQILLAANVVNNMQSRFGWRYDFGGHSRLPFKV